MNHDLARGPTEISSSGLEGGGGEIRQWTPKMRNGQWGPGGVIQGEFFTGMSYDPHFLHLMNKRSAI